jgi:hypothetical protein
VDVVSFTYLASPYTPHEGESVAERVEAAAKATAQLMQAGHAVFSPIVHSHHVADHLPDDKRMDHEFWMHQDLPILARAARVVVLRLPGWGRSLGIAKEMAEAHARGIPVEFMEP